MNASTAAPRLAPGATAPAFHSATLAHGPLCVPPQGVLHLQFRRFAGCPICSLHLRSFAKRHAELVTAQVTTAAVFHSSLEELRQFHTDLPFAVIGDPERRLYQLYGVEQSLRSVLHPKVVWAGVRGLVQAPSSPWVGGRHPLGLPADFLISSLGYVLAAKYGAHADDHWSVDDLLGLAGAPGRAQAVR